MGCLKRTLRKSDQRFGSLAFYLLYGVERDVKYFEIGLERGELGFKVENALVVVKG